MKKFHLIGLLFFTFSLQAQSSYYFSEVLPSPANKVTQVDQKYFGEYAEKDSPFSYEVSAEGITVVSVQVSSVSKSFIRESTSYNVKDGFIFGVVANDSLPCIYEKGRYYFGVRNKEKLIGGESLHTLTQIDASHYIINYNENGNFLPALLEFSGGNLTIKEFNYDPITSSFPFISDQSTVNIANQQLVILSPTAEEFTQLNAPKYFQVSGTFLKK